jgi:hypothetical protein
VLYRHAQKQKIKKILTTIQPEIISSLQFPHANNTLFEPDSSLGEAVHGVTKNCGLFMMVAS